MALWLMMSNSFSNWHRHKTEHGIVTYHAHEYSRNHSDHNQSSPFENHHHTKDDFFLLSFTIFQLIFVAVFVAIFVIYYLKRKKRLLPSFMAINIAYKKSIPLRGPPVFSIL